MPSSKPRKIDVDLSSTTRRGTTGRNNRGPKFKHQNFVQTFRSSGWPVPFGEAASGIPALGERFELGGLQLQESMTAHFIHHE